MAALFCDPNLLRPLPKGLHGNACAACDRRQAVWEHTASIRDRSGEFVCSLCWLYSSSWTIGNEEELVAFVQKVEQQMETVFEKTDRGQLKNCVDADRILASVVMSSRMFLLRGKVQSWERT